MTLPRVQFTLKGLLVSVAFCAVFLTIYSAQSRRYEERMRALARIRKWANAKEYEDDNVGVIARMLFGRRSKLKLRAVIAMRTPHSGFLVYDIEHFRNKAHIPNFMDEELLLLDSPDADSRKNPEEKNRNRQLAYQAFNESLKDLLLFPEIESVELKYSDASDSSMAFFASLPNLIWLDLDGADITDVGLASLEKSPTLASLSLRHTLIGDDGVATLERINNLQMLSIGCTRITNESIASIRKLKKLKYLELSSAPINDDFVAGICDLPEIELLNVSETRITDRSIPDLSRLAKLKTLVAMNTRLSPAGVERLRKTRPQIDINAGTINIPSDCELNVRN